MENETNGNNNKPKSRWSRQNILLTFGLTVVVASWINSEVLGNTFHFEYLLVAAAFCGVSITQWGDRK